MGRLNKFACLVVSSVSFTASLLDGDGIAIRNITLDKSEVIEEESRFRRSPDVRSQSFRKEQIHFFVFYFVYAIRSYHKTIGPMYASDNFDAHHHFVATFHSMKHDGTKTESISKRLFECWWFGTNGSHGRMNASV